MGVGVGGVGGGVGGVGVGLGLTGGVVPGLGVAELLLLRPMQPDITSTKENARIARNHETQRARFITNLFPLADSWKQQLSGRLQNRAGECEKWLVLNQQTQQPFGASGIEPEAQHAYSTELMVP